MPLKPEGAPWLAIVNPAAGRPGARARWPRIERALRMAGLEVESVRTVRPGEGESLARRAVTEGRRRILVAGGDGTVHEVVNGVMTAGLADTREITLAVAPTGTGNDWARSLGVGRRPEAIADVLATGRTVLHDIGIIDRPQAAAEPRRYFVNVAGAGFDAYVAARVPRPVPSALTYLAMALRGLATYRAPRFRISSGDFAIEGKMLLVFAAIGQYCGNRMHVAPTARPDDGLFDILAVQELRLGAVLTKLAKLYGGRILGDPAVGHWRTPRVRIESSPAARVQADGQMAGETPVEFSILRQALRVVVR